MPLVTVKNCDVSRHTHTHRVFFSFLCRCVFLISEGILNLKARRSNHCKSHWPCDLRRMFKAAWLLGSLVRIPLRAWMFVSCVCRVLCKQRRVQLTDYSFRGVLPCVCVCVSNCVWYRNFISRQPRPDLGCCVTKKKSNHCGRILVCVT